MLTFQPHLKEGLAGYFLLLGQQQLAGLRLLSPTTLIYRLLMTQHLPVGIWKKGGYSLMVNLDI